LDNSDSCPYNDIIVRLQAQPNRKTGVCETDTFVVTGGASNDLRICGLNSGQHGKLLDTRRTTRNCVKSGFTIYTYASIVQNNNFIARSRSFEALYSRIRNLSRYNIISTTCHHTKLCGLNLNVAMHIARVIRPCNKCKCARVIPEQ